MASRKATGARRQAESKSKLLQAISKQDDTVASAEFNVSGFPSKCSASESCCCYLLDYGNDDLPQSLEEKTRLCSCSRRAYCATSRGFQKTDPVSFCPKLPGSVALTKTTIMAKEWKRTADSWDTSLQTDGKLLDGMEAALDSLDNDDWWNRWLARTHTFFSVSARLRQAKDGALSILGEIEEALDHVDQKLTPGGSLERKLMDQAEEVASAMKKARSQRTVGIKVSDVHEDREAAGLIATLQNLTSCLRDWECRSSSDNPALHISGYNTWTAATGVRGAERVIDFSTLEVAEFRYRGANIAASFRNKKGNLLVHHWSGGNVYGGLAWKGEMHSKTVADAYSGPFVGGVQVVPISAGIHNDSTVTAAVTVSADKGYKPQRRLIKALTFSASGDLLQATPGIFNADVFAASYDYNRGHCFASASKFFRFVWHAGDASPDSTLQKLDSLSPLVWLRRLVYTIFYLLNRNSARPLCSTLAAREGGIEGPATILARLRQLAKVNAAARIELQMALMRMQATPSEKRCCCDTDLGTEGEICLGVLPKPNGRCPKADLGRGMSQTHECDTAEKEMNVLNHNLVLNHTAAPHRASWTYEDLAVRYKEELKKLPGQGKDTLPALQRLGQCSAGRGKIAATYWMLGALHRVEKCSKVLPLRLCGARENCVQDTSCECDAESCYDAAEKRCLPMGEVNLKNSLALQWKEEKQSHAEFRRLEEHPLCAVQQHAHELYCKEKNVPPKFCTENVCQTPGGPATSSGRPKQTRSRPGKRLVGQRRPRGGAAK